MKIYICVEGGIVQNVYAETGSPDPSPVPVVLDVDSDRDDARAIRAEWDRVAADPAYESLDVTFLDPLDDADGVIEAYPKGSARRKTLQAAAKRLSKLAGVEIRVKDCWFDEGTGMRWTTMLAESFRGDWFQALSPAEQGEILSAGCSDRVLARIAPRVRGIALGGLVAGTFASVWDDGETTVECPCLVDLERRRIVSIDTSKREVSSADDGISERNVDDAVSSLDEQYVEIGDKRYPAFPSDGRPDGDPEALTYD